MSGCEKLEIINQSSFINIINKVIYNKFKTSVIGCLNSIETNELILEPVKSIGRNSFWNCKGIKKIVLPSSLQQIGYNPFVGCSNIHFESNTDKYRVIDDVLYDEFEKKLICYPAWKAVGSIKVPDNIEALERGAFSGCDRMTHIELNNVKIISKSCFTNCVSLLEIKCSENIEYIGEWAFAYCSSLQEALIARNTQIDNNAFLNCKANIQIY